MIGFILLYLSILVFCCMLFGIASLTYENADNAGKIFAVGCLILIPLLTLAGYAAFNNY